MASQIAHIVYAAQYLKQYPAPKNRDYFLQGVVFPDIRRISNVTRDQTHHRFEDLELNFQKLNSFEAGWKFHVWCDLRRNEILRDQGFYGLSAIKNYHYLTPYFLEDVLIWKEYNNWETVSNVLSHCRYLAMFPELQETDWQCWYSAVGAYVREVPQKQKIEQFLKLQPSVATKIPRIMQELDSLAGNKEVVSLLFELHKKIIPIVGQGK